MCYVLVILLDLKRSDLIERSKGAILNRISMDLSTGTYEIINLIESKDFFLNQALIRCMSTQKYIANSVCS